MGIFMLLLLSANFFSKQKKILSGIQSKSNSLDPDQAQHFVRPVQGPNSLQMLSTDDTSRQRVKRYNGDFVH